MLYIYEHGFLDGGWVGLWRLVVIRDLVVAWQHPFFTAFTGIGLAVARLNRQILVKLVAVPIGYAFAVATHAFHNSFASLMGGLEGFALGSLIDWLGWCVMAIFIVFMIFRERALLKRQLMDEASSGVISPAQYQRALSPLTTSTARLTGGRSAARFYQACAELAHKKEQLLKFDDEGGNAVAVRSLRRELATLGPGVN